MGEHVDSSAAEADKPKKPLAMRVVPVIVVLAIVGGAFAIISRPGPGQRISTDTSTQIIVSASKGDSQAEFPVALQEGSDPEHEADHIIQPLKGVDGVSSATLDWASSLVLRVQFDSAKITAEQIEAMIAQSGYLVDSVQ